jgi:hypothetical protein
VGEAGAGAGVAGVAGAARRGPADGPDLEPARVPVDWALGGSVAIAALAAGS